MRLSAMVIDKRMTHSAPKPIPNEIIERKSTEPTIALLFRGFKALKYLTCFFFGTSGPSFQKTSDHIRAIMNKVRKLPNIMKITTKIFD